MTPSTEEHPAAHDRPPKALEAHAGGGRNYGVLSLAAPTAVALFSVAGVSGFALFASALILTSVAWLLARRTLATGTNPVEQPPGLDSRVQPIGRDESARSGAEVPAGGIHGTNDSAHALDRFLPVLHECAQLLERIRQLGEETESVEDGMQSMDARAVELAMTLERDLVRAEQLNAELVGRAPGTDEVTSSLRVLHQYFQNQELAGSKTGDELESLRSAIEGIRAAAENIEEVADETNLLAMNAAIEASRVGAGGHGFAILSEEMRTLGERCSQSTTRIIDLVPAIVDRLEAAHRRVAAGKPERWSARRLLERLIADQEKLAMSDRARSAQSKELMNNLREHAGNGAAAAQLVRNIATTARKVSRSTASAGDRLGRVCGALRQRLQQSVAARAHVAAESATVTTDRAPGATENNESEVESCPTPVHS